MTCKYEYVWNAMLQIIKNVLLASSTLALFSACSKEPLDFRNSELSNGAVYVQGANKPFTGHVTNIPMSQIPLARGQNKMLGELIGKYVKESGDGEMGEVIFASIIGSLLNGKDNSAVLCNIDVKDGIPDGKFKCFYTNEIDYMSGNFSNGKFDNQLILYRPFDHKNHEVMSVDLKDGKLAGNLMIKSYLTGDSIYEETREENLVTGKYYAPNKVLVIEFEKDGNNLVKQKSYEPVSGKLIGEMSFKPQSNQMDHGIFATYRRTVSAGEKYITPESPWAVTQVVKYENGILVSDLMFNNDFSMDKLVFSSAKPSLNAGQSVQAKAISVNGDNDPNQVLEGNCHMGSCNYTKVLTKEIVSSSEFEVQMQATILNGNKDFEGEYPTSIPSDIEWYSTSENVQVTCSYANPKIGSNDLVDLDFTMVSDVQISAANLYFALCHNSYDGYPSGTEVFQYPS